MQQALAEEGVTLTDDAYYATYLGLDDKNCFRAVLNDHGKVMDNEGILEIVDRKTAYYDRWKDEVPIIPGAPEFVRTAAERYPLAVGSGAFRHEIEYALDRAGIRDAIRVIVSADDIEHSKLAPDCYLTALERLNDTLPAGASPLQASECVVIEDAIHGITAAKAACMRCVAVTSTYPAERLAEADRVVPGLAALDIERLGRAFVN
jgi:HAD superfamily hydrolase (TIGR01509 family)